MIHIVLSIVTFGISFVLHALTIRLGFFRDRFWYNGLWYVLGFAGLIALFFLMELAAYNSFLPLPVTALVLYASLCIAVVPVVISPILGQVSPTSEIMKLSSGGILTDAIIRSLWRKNRITTTRMQDLVDIGFVRVYGKRYYAKLSGTLIAAFTRCVGNFIALDKRG